MNQHEREEILAADDLEDGPHSLGIYLQESYPFLMEKSLGENKQTNSPNVFVFLAWVVAMKKEGRRSGVGGER